MIETSATKIRNEYELGFWEYNPQDYWKAYLGLASNITAIISKDVDDSPL